MTLNDTELYEFNTHAFVIKIWLEDNARWRGYITHVPSGERRYIQTLSEIDDFILPYLENMGIQRKALERLFSRFKLGRSRRGATAAPREPMDKNGGAGA